MCPRHLVKSCRINLNRSGGWRFVRTVRVLGCGVIARRRFGVGQEREDHGPGRCRGIPGFPLVTADQLLLVGDELTGFLAGEGEPGALHGPGPVAPLAHGCAGGAEPREALQVLAQAGRLQPGVVEVAGPDV